MTQTDTPASTDAQNAEQLALDAERRIDSSTNQTERDYWTRMADFWWGQA